MNNNSSNNNLNGKHHFSIVLSFAVAMFAIISLIAVGFNQISFAAPNDGTNTGSSFKLATYQRSVVDPMSEQSTIKPVSPPKAIPLIITSASTGFICGSAANAERPATVSAHKTAISISSRA